MAFILAVHPDSAPFACLRERRGNSDAVVRVGDADLAELILCANLFDVMIISAPVLGGDPEQSVARLMASGAPPLIVVGSSLAEDRRIELLNAGVAFCLSEPVGSRELAARVSALLARDHRSGSAPRSIITIGDWILDREGRRLFKPGHKALRLTSVELDLLLLLLSRKERVMSREYIIYFLGRASKSFDLRSVDVYMSRLRRKVRATDLCSRLSIKAVPNEGYVCLPKAEVTVQAPTTEPKACEPSLGTQQHRCSALVLPGGSFP